MKKIMLFYLEHCPYCINAKKALKELIDEKPEYGDIQIQWVEESVEAGLAGRYDYYYVPTIFHEGKKLYEADPSQNYASIKESIRAAFESVLQ